MVIKLTIPKDITVKTLEETNPIYTGKATATSDHPENLKISWVDSEANGCCGNQLIIRRQWIAVDGFNQEVFEYQRIYVNNKTPSLIKKMEVIEIPKNEPKSLILPEQKSRAVDNIDNGTFVSITCKDMTVSCKSDIPPPDTSATQPGNYTNYDITNDCGPAIITNDNLVDLNAVHVMFLGDQTISACGSIERTYRVHNNCGNEDQCIQTITVANTTPPV